VPLQVELVSPERTLYSGLADGVILRTIGGGDIAFLTGHAPFLGALEVEVARIQEVDGDEQRFAIHGGFVEVSSDKVTILSDTAEHADDIDIDRAFRAQAEAEKQTIEDDDAEAEAALRRAHARLRATGNLEA
jgi:F-type H+-transporting ATPase subunit epsilon